MEIPDKTAPVKIENERASGKALGDTVLIVMQSMAPANPAKPALIVNASTCNLAELIPDNSEATLFDLIDLKVLPNLDCSKLLMSHIANKVKNKEIQNNHLY